MFRVYKPKPKLTRVRAVQVTEENLEELASTLMGRVVLREGKVAGFDVATFDGPLHFSLGSYVVKKDDNSLVSISKDDFDEDYEVARNTKES